ncbi:MAG: phosphatidylglycerophosphatase A [Pseudomonadales bacterium]|nr:phosphatidylglycerophosphatase A [Pseudomonadales bacterium]MDP6469591.1 phosphatidylglycerophosphatase A [Pseudomonadales bacterium]MDP6827432.1 phosphatidylglycerophosphatase A [Pseudomonadales bacterium]MDP6971255.1 phosphatidylglycerophosphatase A [Pseudomonadales bacterium]
MSRLPRTFADPWLLVATGFGSGFLPKAPGTWGSLVAVALWWLIPADPVVQTVAVVIAFFTGWRVTHEVCRRFEVGDAGEIVIDEIVGMWIVLLVVPRTLLWTLAAFAAFRFFDILKPPPIRWVERSIPGALGVMADDIVAGVLSAGVLAITVWLL